MEIESPRRRSGGLREPLLEAREVSKQIKISEGTLANWRWRGTGPRWSKVGNRVRYRREDVDAWLDAQSQGGGAAA